MATADIKERVVPKDYQRMELRSLVMLASEPISHYWPMQTFIHHNPLHGLEHLPFVLAVEQGKRFLGGNGYLSNEEYQNYFRQGRISEESINEALGPVSQNKIVTIGDRNISHLQALRTLLINGTGKMSADVASVVLQESLNEPHVRGLVDKLQTLSATKQQSFSIRVHAEREQQELASLYTLGFWCDKTLGTRIQDQINLELIKWCGGFLDEGHAPWPMPLRDKTFYGGWKELAQEDLSGPLLGIQDWKTKLNNLPDRPEDAILESLALLALPRDLWIDYFTLHLAQLSGWTGFIKWRSEQSDHEWQRAFRIDLVKYMAVRLFYERELVALTCQEKLGMQGTYASILSFLNDHPIGFGLYKEFKMHGLPNELIKDIDPSLFIEEPLRIENLDRCGADVISTWETIRRQQEIDSQALILLHLARSFDFSVKELVASSPETLETLLEWADSFSESLHGPIWLRAFEATYLKNFVKHISPNLQKLCQSDALEDRAPESRPLAQAIFCIDVRSEGFRRHFEEVGGNETFGFAGFFGIPICYQGFGSEQETDQCPVLLKPKHRVKEIPRAYQGKAAEQFLERQQLAKTGHTLLHDLKENVITPYVMVEAIGWFFGFRLFGQTLLPRWYKAISSWVKERFAIPIGTTLTVEKITHDEAEEMVASEHRATIYRMLIERYGRRGTTVSHDQVERLRKQAVNQHQSDTAEMEDLYRLLLWTESDHERFIRDLRKDFDVHERAMTRRMRKITQTGFTVTEQAYYVETALRIIGFTKTFARLVLICAHGSSSDNNPYESALDCGACGGNHGISNARALAAMANKAEVRQLLAQKGIVIPPDTRFLPGQHDTTTDEVVLFDLEDVPATHRKDLIRIQHDLEKAGHRNSHERLTRFPEETRNLPMGDISARTKLRSIDWSQVRPEWGLSRHSAFIIGRRLLTLGINLEGRTFLHSYDYLQDPNGKYLEIIMTAPMIVGNWINMEHYFSTVDPFVYGAGSKVYHNVVGRVGVMYGSQSDLCVGLPIQTVSEGERPYHEPMRLFVIIEASLEMITTIISRHDILKRLIGNHWINLVALDPVTMEFFLHDPPEDWRIIH